MSYTAISFLQILLDAAALSLICVALFREWGTVKRKDFLLFPMLSVCCMAARTNYVAGQPENGLSLSADFSFAPANNAYILCVLIAAVLLTVSVLLKVPNGEALCGTMAVFSIYLAARFCGVAFLLLCGITENGTVMGLGSRMITFVPIAFLLCTPAIDSLRRLIRTGSFLLWLAAANIMVFFACLFFAFSFDFGRIASHLQSAAILFLVLLLMDAILLLLNGHREQERKRIRMMEQYIPIVDELISQVRARQHEFNNRLIAIDAAVSSASTLEEAQNSIRALTEGVALSKSDSALLSCDSKIITGLIFSKMKQAELSDIRIECELNGAFRQSRVPETEWIEATGIFLDNAMEASSAGDTIYLKSGKNGDFLELCVYNPYPAMSNTEFMALFRKGVTTKGERSARGYGLYNVLRMAERYQGKLITRNEQIAEKNYVVFGILLP